MASSSDSAAKPSPTSPPESLQVVAQDILVLSILARDVRPIDPVGMRTTGGTKDLGNLSFMMTPGSKQEAGASVGVIGRMDGEGLHAVVMLRNAHCNDPSKSDIKPIPASTQRGRELLKRGWTRPQRDFSDYDAYMVDATSVIQYFCTGSSDREDITADSFTTFAFIVSRCYHKLHARMENGDKVWGGKAGTEYNHPSSYIRRAYEGTNPPSVPEAYFDLPLPLDIIKNILTGRWGLKPSSPSASSDSPLPGNTARSRRFKVSNDNAIQWSRAVHGKFSKTGRVCPDVAANDLNHSVAINDALTLVAAGTFASTPTFASLVSAINDARLATGKTPVGCINHALDEFADAFNDVALGGNLGCNTTGFTASGGWDRVSSLGTPDL
ncbi:uncharacterized protein BXZ73DRAFT_76155 [Epithele typhae]|uniref:uncharacterized protein n=1 Tax=Epithele typhae TaxID=378194 RepID=UPI00200758BA|nr:uncharacterized protein BXZ73DRAFT_76155 [Epithele typhae]KAH9938993.1 hypothetical protein BXZ73DRAFT_76155 [Epithele typhae]